MSVTATRSWRFCRTAGFDHVRIDTPSGLLVTAGLNQAFWVALLPVAARLSDITECLRQRDS